MDILLSFPAVLVSSVLCEWSKICDLVRVDSACCCHSMRNKFLELFTLDEFIIRNCSSSAAAWLTTRHVKVKGLRIENETQLELALLYLFEHGRSVRSLYASQGISQKALQPAIDQCVNLTGLSLRSCDVSTVNLVRNLAHLKSLDLFTFYETVSPSFEGVVMYNITSLTIFGRHWQQHHLAEVLCACPSLQRLKISVHNVKYALEAFLDPFLRNLRSLDSAYLTDAALHAISTVCVCLTDLDMGSCKSCTDDGVLSVVRSLKLRSLRLPCTAHITNTTIHNIALYLADTLQELYVNHDMEDDTGEEWDIETLCQNCTRLQTFKWIGRFWSKDATFANSANTTHLSVYVSVTDELLLQIAEHCVHLVELDISDDNTTLFTCAGVRAVAEQCVNLRTVMLNSMVDKSLFAEIVHDYPVLKVCYE